MPENTKKVMDANGNIQVPEELKAKYMFRLPQAYNFADYIWPGLLMSPQRILAIRDIEFRPTDIIVASYPKSGTNIEYFNEYFNNELLSESLKERYSIDIVAF